MNEYIVQWGILAKGDTPMEAAEWAMDTIQGRVKNLEPTTFKVTDLDTTVITVVDVASGKVYDSR